MKEIRKSVRLSRRVYNYINGYRGDNFCDRLQNYVLDTEERRDQLTLEWQLLESYVQDKYKEMVQVQEMIRTLKSS